ncbi:MAG: immunity 22 family protein [Campylobacteraceae bacterium]|nr:immunity 22 family protein [Campylobacteraceae bacterium]
MPISNANEQKFNLCSNLEIKKANAIFWYQNAKLEISKPHKENYNGLKYIGVFEGD